jgi:polar amino acid transport system substrate-binding protein
MKDQALTMGKKLGFSYGAKVDGLINELAPKAITTDQSNIGMIRMLIGKRFDYMISAPEEATHLIASISTGNEDIAMLEFLDSPSGSKRYILCSESVGDGIIERLNTAILETIR